MERKPTWLEEALDSVIEWPTFDPWGDDNGEA